MPGPHPPRPPRTPLASVRQWLGRQLARYLSYEPPNFASAQAQADLDRLCACLRPGDVILVEGRSRFSTAVKYLTQSSWSHAALYVGEAAFAGRPEGVLPGGGRACVIEADIVDGVRAVGLQSFAGLALRVCRATSLTDSEVQAVIAHARARLGYQYDLQHVFDLLRWMLPVPHLPARFRRGLLTVRGGDPTRAICSTLVAEALQAVRYPILPNVQRIRRVDQPDGIERVAEVLHPRYARLFVPRDFDLSPYFEVVKPELAGDFDHRRLAWFDAYIDPDAPAQVGTDPTPAHPQPSRRRIAGPVVDAIERSAVASTPSAPAGKKGWRAWPLRLRR